MSQKDEVSALLKQYPVRNRVWSIDQITGSFSAAHSDLGLLYHDPWYRPIKTMLPSKDTDGNIVMWTATVFVDGQPISLTVYNS